MMPIPICAHIELLEHRLALNQHIKHARPNGLVKRLSKVQRHRIVTVWHIKNVDLFASAIGLVQGIMLRALHRRHLSALAGLRRRNSANIVAETTPIAGNIGFAANVQRDNALQDRARWR